MSELIEAVLFARKCFQIFRRHQRTFGREGLTTYTAEFHGVPRVAMLLGTGREAWRVSDMATTYYAQRGVHTL